MIQYKLKWNTKEDNRIRIETYNEETIEDMYYHKRRATPRLTKEQAENPELFGKTLLDYYNKTKTEYDSERLFISCEKIEIPEEDEK